MYCDVAPLSECPHFPRIFQSYKCPAMFLWILRLGRGHVCNVLVCHILERRCANSWHNVARATKFVPLRLIFVGPQCEKSFMSPFWNL